MTGKFSFPVIAKIESSSENRSVEIVRFFCVTGEIEICKNWF